TGADLTGADPAGDADRGDQGTVRDHLDRFGPAQVGAPVQVAAVDVPGVPLGGGVGVQLRQVAAGAGGEDLTVGDEIGYRGEQAVRVDLHAQQAVVEHGPVDGHRGDAGRKAGAAPSAAESRCAGPGRRTVGQHDDLGPIVWCRVEHAGRTGELTGCPGDQ